MVDLAKAKFVYLIGIKGSAMASLAEILVSQGIKVLGSDTEDVFYTDELLKKLGITYFEGFNPGNIPPGVDLVIYSTAYNAKNNSEMNSAIGQNLPVLSYPEALGQLFNKAFGLAVCGTHGKTTTSAMLAEILKIAGLKPTALIGSKVANWGTGSLSDKGKYFVIEADEYQNKLQYYKPKGVAVTNIDYDHPDFFKTKQDYIAVFQKFFKKIPETGFLVFNIQDQSATKIVQDLKCALVSFSASASAKADFKILKRVVGLAGQIVTFSLLDQIQLKVKLKLFGEHNALNALAALAVAWQLGIEPQKAKEALEGFLSSERRFQKMGEFNQAFLYDDYAHHPREITATLKAVREKYPKKKIIIGFHPHTYTRTQVLLADFAKALAEADKVYVLDIYSSAREKKEDFKVTSKDLVDSINKNGGKARYLPFIEELAETLKKELDQSTVFVSLGAGDIWKVHELILK